MAIDDRLQSVCDLLTAWGDRHRVQFDLVRDEEDCQGFLMFRRDCSKLPELCDEIYDCDDYQKIHFSRSQVKSGTVLTFSIRSVNETDPKGDEAVKSGPASRISAVFNGPAPAPEPGPAAVPEPLRDGLLRDARTMREAQRKVPTRAVAKAQATGRYNRVTGPDDSNSTKSPGQSANEPGGAAKGLTEFNDRLAGVLAEIAEPPAPGLEGLGAENQPGDLFQRFAQALQVLGQQMRLGAPLQDLLKKQGINWKKSEDGQAILFFVQNAATNAPQPIARVGYQTLAKPQEFQKQLSSMLDFAKGQAPGTEQQKYDEAQEAMKQMRDIANNMAPQDPQKGGGSAAPMVPQSEPQMQPVASVEPAAPDPAEGGVGPITKSKPEQLGQAAHKAAGVKPKGGVPRG